MNILVFSKNDSPVSQRLLRCLTLPSAPNTIVTVSSTDALARHLSQPGHKPDVVVLLAEAWQDLFELVTMAQQLDDNKVILILPDDRTETFSLGCRLYPRYICSLTNDFQNVRAVIEKMARVIDLQYDSAVRKRAQAAVHP